MFSAEVVFDVSNETRREGEERGKDQWNYDDETKEEAQKSESRRVACKMECKSIASVVVVIGIAKQQSRRQTKQQSSPIEHETLRRGFHGSIELRLSSLSLALFAAINADIFSSTNRQMYVTWFDFASATASSAQF